MKNYVLISDAQQLFKESIGHVINHEIDEDCICKYYCTYKSLKQDIARLNNNIKLVILSTNLVDITNINRATSGLKTITKAPILVTTSINSQFFAREIIDSGAISCMVKTESHENCKVIINTILTGKKYTQPGKLNHKNTYNLTKRQYEVLSEISQGLLNKEIAAKLDISESTVKIHISTILAKLSVNNRTEAVVKFFYEAS